MKYCVIEVDSDYYLPYKFIGSTIRGAFGVGLKRVVCINPAKECNKCFAKDGCLYYDFFEKDFAKFRLDFEINSRVNFKMFLFEEAVEKAPYVISGLYNAFKEVGLGVKREKIDFLMRFNNQLIYDGEFKNFKNTPLEVGEFEYQKELKFIIKTPIRVKENGKFVRDGLKLETILRSINHRLLKLQNKSLEKLSFTPEYDVKRKDLSFIDFSRYSNRQKTKMKLGGIIGEIEFSFLDEKSFKLLKLAEIIGVGKQVTFGLGSVRVES